MAELLEMAWIDTTRINTPGAIWAIPVAVVFKLKNIKKESGKQSLLGDPKLIPSRQRKLQTLPVQLRELEQKQFTKLIESEIYLNSEEFRRFQEKYQQLSIRHQALDSTDL